jgi:hypothetical protein
LTPNLYNVAFQFWSLLITENEELPGGFALANLELPLLLANAVWYPQVGELKTVAEWYAKRNLPTALIVSGARDSNLERTLQEGPFTLEQSFGFLQLNPQETYMAVVEQASWLQARNSADILAGFYSEGQWNLELAQTLSKAMQADTRIQNYIAYTSKPVGAMITFTEKPFHSAMLYADSEGALWNRLEQDAQNLQCTAYVLRVLDKAQQVRPEYRLERWSIR